MSHCTGATIKVDEMMGSFESFCGGDESYSLDSASALPFLDPGLYVTLKEKREKNRVQRAWRGLRRLAGLNRPGDEPHLGR